MNKKMEVEFRDKRITAIPAEKHSWPERPAAGGHVPASQGASVPQIPGSRLGHRRVSGAAARSRDSGADWCRGYLGGLVSHLVPAGQHPGGPHVRRHPPRQLPRPQ